MVLKRKSSRYVLALLMVVILLAGCTSNNNGGNDAESPKPSDTAATTAPTESPKDDNAPRVGGTLTVSTFSDIVTVNPLYVQDTASGDIGYLLYSSLYNLDRSGNIVAEPWSLAAELPQISEDGKTYTIKLKNTAKWSDGQPVTADDVVYTINTSINPAAGSPAIATLDKIDKVEKVDDYTLKITLKQVYAPFQYSLMLSPVPAHILKDVKVEELQAHPYGKDPAQTVTNGPWKWSEWKTAQYVSVEADPNYWGEVKPNIQKIVYKIYADQNTEVQALIKGEVDTTLAIPIPQIDAVKSNDKIKLVTGRSSSYEYISFNFDPNNHPGKFVPFASQKARQAIAHALNRQGMVDNVLKGTGALMNSPFMPGSWADSPNAVNYSYDAEQAKKLLAEDGWVAGKDGILEKDGKRFSFELQYNSGNSRREQVSTIIQQNLKDVGIEVVPKAMDFATWIDQNITPGKYPAILLGWSLSNPDPDAESIFSSKYFPPTGQNVGWYKNEKLDKLWVDGYSVVDQAARKTIYDEIAKEISADLPYIFLYQYGNPQGVGPKVKYAEEDAPEPSHQTGYFYHIIKWWLTV
ncbi:peptide-binding protein [Paenibacillus sp. NEAU-GSW1]|uniref:peptide-binding protein n=1 Tax=Paenibacillus sp. NEAU-GSW1 TaxID=2682486 RepID=UPI0012E26CBF|nr:peptide-binding protein [Paenibacillus sp. NEAU-GSW1]MUT64326.1 peptide ABC transporter substrate-binding protein [Paenibacillus sp. NEAU-GSW1]